VILLRRTAIGLGVATAAWSLSVSATAAEPGFRAPAARDVVASGVLHEAQWSAPCGTVADADEMELVLSLDGGRTFPIRLTSELPPCTTHFRWRVPNVSTERARLAVRQGREGRAEAEEIAILSPEFRITAFDPDDAEQIQGPSEVWTEQALREIGAENRLPGSVRRPTERLEAVETDEELELPSPQAQAPAVDSRRCEATTTIETLAVGKLASRAPSAPVPMRV
jgi:hypothetical protein